MNFVGSCKLNYIGICKIDDNLWKLLLIKYKRGICWEIYLRNYNFCVNFKNL